jgi:hypothetical protein
VRIADGELVFRESRSCGRVHLVYFFALQSRANCPPHSPPRPPAKDNPAPRNTKTWGSQHLDMGHLLEYIEVLVSSSSHRRGCPSWRRGALLAAAMRGPRCCTVLAPHAARPGGPLHAITAPSTHRRQVLRCGGRCTEHRRRRDARARTRLAADAGAGRSLYRALPSQAERIG